MAIDTDDSSTGSTISSMSSKTRRTTESKITQLSVQVQDLQAEQQAEPSRTTSDPPYYEDNDE
jgi:hypothetical protein